MLSQRSKIVPPQSVDIGNLQDFASVIQQAFDEVFEDAHIHTVRTSAPSETEGSVGDVMIVVLSSVGYLYVKCPTIGWKRVALS